MMVGEDLLGQIHQFAAIVSSLWDGAVGHDFLFASAAVAVVAAAAAGGGEAISCVNKVQSPHT